MDAVDNQTGSVTRLRRAVQMVDIAARILSAYIGYYFNGNLRQLFETGTEVFVQFCKK